ncbi:MAG: HWE histidine kinase domain-containing protein [Pseudomonadota bacterium]
MSDPKAPDPPGSPGAAKLDLSSCDREAIHIIGSVQQTGVLIAFDDNERICHVGGGVGMLFGSEDGQVTPQTSEDAPRAVALLGQPLSTLFAREAVHALRNLAGNLIEPDTVERQFGLDLCGNGLEFDLGLHRSGDTFVLEAMPAEGVPYKRHIAFVRAASRWLRRARDDGAFFTSAALYLRLLTGFDRVVVYRFHDDDSGEVVGEDCDPSITDSFLGLRYPASDIPQQARALYLRNEVRSISNVDAPLSPVLPEPGPGEVALDLSMSCLRSVSPIHLEYLRNMGVQASMSVSIIVNDRLWGLFACHHRTPRTIAYPRRCAAELYGQLFSLLLEQRIGQAERTMSANARAFQDRIVDGLRDGVSVAERFEEIEEHARSVIPFDGIALWVEGEYRGRGLTPTRSEFEKIAAFLDTVPADRLFHTDALARYLPEAAEMGGRACGVLAIPISRTVRDYLVLFRREIAETVRWAGNPEKPATLGPNGIRLTPRKSFEAWRETVSGKAPAWSEAELRMADALRVSLLQLVLRLTDRAAGEERERAFQRQGLLIAELNHRVRNILNLIRGLVEQSKPDTLSPRRFASDLMGRINALALAHDMITDKNWSSVSVHSLLYTEFALILREGRDRLAIGGTGAKLIPEAFTTLALVIHELLTNSVKYGALSNEAGTVAVALSAEPDGGLRVVWRESGGPAVTMPSHGGLGRTLIEQSIPFELKGSAVLRFAPQGVEADFVLPSRCVTGFYDSSQPSPVLVREKAAEARLSGISLIVEDNLMIAMSGRQLLLEIGAEQVVVASTVADALAAVARTPLTFAMLDVNLQTETSEAVAERLQAAGVPFVFSTGYGSEWYRTDAYPGVPVLRKPLKSQDLHRALNRLLADTA